MYLVLSPFFYYIANEQFIHDFIAIESSGKRPYHLSNEKLKLLIERFISLNSHGVDLNKKDKYISYIVEHISQT